MLEQYLPTNENQFFLNFDALDCTTFSFLNCLETQLNKIIKDGTIPLELLAFLSNNKYIDANNSVNFSDQYLGVLSGNTKQGNTFENVMTGAIQYGLIPDSMFQDNPTDWNSYYDKSKITIEMMQLGQEFLKRFKLESTVLTHSVEWMKQVLNETPLWITIQVCDGYNEPKPIQPCVFPATHAVELYAIDDTFHFYDSYPPYKKQLASANSIFAVWQVKINPINTMLKTIKEQGRKETYVVINGKNYWIKSADTFNNLKAEGLIGDWDRVANQNTPIEAQGIID